MMHEWWVFPVPEGMTAMEAYDEIRLFGRLLPEHVPEDGARVTWAAITHAVWE